MRPRRTSLALLSAPLLAGLAGLAGCGSDGTGTTSSGGTSTSSSSTGGGGTGGGDPDAYLAAPSSCAYECDTLDKCPEKTKDYACPALGAWAAIPHLEACPAWDGKYPTPAAGKCAATAPTGAALAKTGPDPTSPGTRVLPDGRRIKPAGAEWPFDEADQAGGSTGAVARVPGSKFVITVDTGNDDHAVRAVDTTLIGAQSPVTGFVKFTPPSWLNASAAALSTGRVYVATAYGKVQALDLDLVTGALTRNDAASLDLPLSGTKPWYAAAVAASPDEKRLVVTSVLESRLFVFDVDPTSPTAGQKLGELDLGDKDSFAAAFDPADPSGHFVYVTIWGGRKIVEVDLSNPTAPALTRSFSTDKNPEGFAFLDARWIAVANDFGETISLVDRATGTSSSVPVDFEPGLKGLDVSGLAFDPIAKRLYATLAGIDAIAAYDVDLAKTPPALTPAGRLAASWWPTGMAVHPDGSLTVVNLRGRPIGPYPVPNPIGDGGGDVQMKGSVQQIPKPTAADLVAGEAQVGKSVAVGAQPGYPTVDCPSGAKDFPVPATNTEGPSPVIKHIVFIVRENKTYDSLFGDLASAEGDPALAFKATTAEMDQIWPNLRDLARTFAMSDNFYNLAVKSTQGHHWTTYGRATDFCERTWSDDLRPAPLCGISDLGRAEEGSLFEWLQKNNVPYDILGEIVGQPLAAAPAHNPIDVKYPGGPFQNITYVDLEKACYTAGRLRVACNLGSFVYMTLPNDHTIGASPDNPTAEVMCAVNDEATGMVVDAVSHSPFWADALVVITEDDPQAGGDHVDYHRTPLVLVSPWIKRGYVSKTHIDVASLHKLFAHLLGLSYPNLLVKNAALPLDLFTSTPDYTPYTYAPRKIPLACGGNVTKAEQELTASWDFHEVDEQPGLGEQVFRIMRGAPLQELSPALRRAIEARRERRARGIQDRDGD